MTKKIIKPVAVLLIVCLGFSLTACIKGRDIDRKNDEKIEVIEANDFENIMEDLDYTVEEGDLEKGVDTYLKAYDEDLKYFVAFSEFESEANVMNGFNKIVHDYKDAEEDNYFEGSIKETEDGNFEKAVIKGNYEDTERYVVMVRADNMIIIATVFSTDEDDIKKIDKIIKKLGY